MRKRVAVTACLSIVALLFALFGMIQGTKGAAAPAVSSPPAKAALPAPSIRRTTRAAQAPEVEAGQTTTLLPDGRWLVTGGEGKNGPQPSVVISDSRVGKMSALGDGLRQPRLWHTATLLPDGSVFIYGGVGADKKAMVSAEILDPLTGKSELIPSGNLTPRAEHTATLLSDGHVLIAGGIDDRGKTINKVDLWDPQTKSSVTLPSGLQSGRRRHKATLLPDGNVLLWGGQNARKAGVEDGEIYETDKQSFSWAGVQPPRDDGAPYVVFSSPKDGEASVPRDVRLAIRFSKPLSVESLNSETATLAGPDGQVVVRVVPAEGGMLGFVTPQEPLQVGATYTLSLNGANDNSDQPLAPLTVSFTTIMPEGQEHAPGHQHEGHDGHGQEQSTTLQPNDDETWVPNARNPYGDWRSNRGDSPWQKLTPLQAAPGVTALSGQVLKLNGQPLANVTLQVGDKAARTDSTGRFLLADIPAGHQQMLINGYTANRPGKSYVMCENGVEVMGSKTNVLPYTIWLTAIDTKHVTPIPVPTNREVVVTSPLIPGLEIHIPAGVRLRTHDGSFLSSMSLTPIPVDRTPLPLPAGASFFFTPQAHEAEVESLDGSNGAGFRIIYPNAAGLKPGTTVDLLNYDPDRPNGWYVYGKGTVTRDGRQIVPNPGVMLKKLNCYGGFFDSDAPATGPGGSASDGDPVDLGTGLFVYNKTDLVLPDTLPIVLSRTYRPNDLQGRPFGVGTTHPYEMKIIGDNSSHDPSFGELILPDGGRIRYERTNPGSSPITLEHTATPTKFYKSTLVYVERGLYGGWDIRLLDGTALQFIKKTRGFGIHSVDVRLSGIVDRYGNTTTITRDEFLRITRISSPNGRWMEFSYDSDPNYNYRIVQVKDNIGRTVGYTYDASNRLWKVTDVNGGVTEYTYDGASRMLTIKDAKGVVCLTNEYDANGRVQRQTQADGTVYQFAYTLDGDRVVQTDITNPRGLVRRVIFNAYGYQTSEIYGVGRSDQWSFTYERQPVTNLVLSVTDSWNRKTAYTYDATGNVNSVTHLAGTPQAVTTSATFDQIYGNILSIADPLNHTATFDYDDKGRLTKATDPLDHHISFTYNGAGQLLTATNAVNVTTARFTYEDGDLTKVVGPYGRTLTQYVDAAGRTASVTNSLGLTTRYEYNALNRPTKATDPLGGTASLTYDTTGNILSGMDARGNAVSYTYDDQGRVTSRTDQLQHADTYHYDAYGNMDSVTDRKGQVTQLAYDVFNRLTQITYADSSTVTYAYDVRGRLEQVTDSGSGSIIYAYDDFDRVTSETTPQGSVSYTYDAAGRVTSMQVYGQPAVLYTYDAANRLTHIAQGLLSADIDYDAAGRRTKLTLPNGLVTEYDYDDASQLKSLTYKQGASVIGDLTFEYDAAGRRTKVGGSYARMLLPQAVTLASYDAANRQTALGNRTLTYDLNGNLTSDGTNTYTWDARDRLVGMSGPGLNVSFQYDVAGRRIGKTVNGQATSYLYDGDNIVQEQSGGTPTANMLNGGLDEVFRRTDGTGAWTPLRDSLGSTLALTDGSGTVQTSYSYGPFGDTAQGGAASSNTSQYAGRENDGTGLYYNRARYYSPALQRFISEDPIGLAGGSNSYAYTSNDPVNFVDPSGLAQTGPVNYLRNPCSAEHWIVNGASNTLSDILMLDHFAEWAWIVGDHCRPASERVWAGAKGVGMAAVMAFGGEIAEGVGGAIFKGGSSGGRVLYRLITELEPADNLLSNAAKGLAARGPEIAEPLIHKGLSMFNSLEKAVAKIPVLERGGHTVYGIAEIRIPAGAADVTVIKTLGAGHYTVVAEPATLIKYWVQSILR